MNKKDLLIREFSLFKAVSQLRKPIADSTHTLIEISFIVLRLNRLNSPTITLYLVQ